MIPIRFPSDSVFNHQASALPLHAMSAQWVKAFIPPSSALTTWTSGKYGMPIQSVPPAWRKMEFLWESDDCLYPLANNPAFDSTDTDQHWSGVDVLNNLLYEIYGIYPGQNDHACSGSIWYLGSNALRDDGWTSASESGLPIAPLSIRYDEAHQGGIRHALMLSLPWVAVDNSYVWPARHVAEQVGILPNGVPLGTRLRLRGDYPMPPGMSVEASRILAALRDYGAFVGDRNGDLKNPAMTGQITLEADCDTRLNMILQEITSRTAGISQWIEFVDESAFMVDPNSGRWRMRR